MRDRLKTAYSEKKSYADNRRRDHEFEIGYCIYLKITLIGLMRFCKKGKLSPRFVGPYEVLQWIKIIDDELKLPNQLSSVIRIEGLVVNEYLSYQEVSVKILDRHVKKLRNIEVVSVKFLLRNHLVESAT